MQLRNAPTGLMREFGYGQGYKNAHNEPEHVARGMRYLPEELGETQYYVPGSLGFEASAAERLAKLRSSERPSHPERNDHED